jgi:hypothetical protein
MIVALETLPDFVGIGAPFETQAGKTFSKDLLDVSVDFLESGQRRCVLGSIEPLVHIGAAITIVVLAVHAVLLSGD